MTARSDDTHSRVPAHRQCVGWVLRSLAKPAAFVGVSLAISSTGAATPVDGQDQGGKDNQIQSLSEGSGPASGKLRSLLQGTWTAPPVFGARNDGMKDAESGDPMADDHDDLGFLDHIGYGGNASTE